MVLDALRAQLHAELSGGYFKILVVVDKLNDMTKKECGFFMKEVW